MKTIFFTFLLLCCCCVTDLTAQEDGFLRTYASEREHDFIESPNGGYLMMGRTTITGFPQIFLRQTDNRGFIAWEKEIPAPSTEIAYEIILANDNSGYILVGNTSLGSDRSNVLALKIDWNGEVIWRNSYGTTDPEYGSTVVAHDDNTYTILGTKMVYEETDSIEKVQLIRINERGESIWSQVYEFEGKHTQSLEYLNSNTFGKAIAYKQVIQTAPNHGIYFLGDVSDTLHIVRVGEFGTIEEDIITNSIGIDPFIPFFNKPYLWGHGIDFKTLEEGGFVLVGNRVTYNWDIGQDTTLNNIVIGTAVMKLNEQGEILWENVYNNEVLTNTFTTIIYRKSTTSACVEIADNGDLVFTTNIVSRDSTDLSTDIRKAYLVRTNANGEEIWNKTYPIPLIYYQMTSLQKSTDDFFVVSGHLFDYINPQSQFENPDEEPKRVFLIKVNKDGEIHGNSIRGQVAFDDNENCEIDSTEQRLKDWQVQLSGAVDTFKMLTDEAGRYAFHVDTGSYTVTLSPPNELWQDCENDISVQLGLLDTTYVDFPSQAMSDCTYLEVDIAAPFLRRCFESSYSISYKNTGTITAEDAYVEVTLDEHLTYQSSTIPVASQDGNIYTFNLGDIDINEGSFFKINVEVSCEVELGQNHCTEAHIFSDVPCAPILYEWEGPILAAEGVCEGDSIIFTIKNEGDNDMEEALQYFVIEDELILMQAPFILNAGADTSFVIHSEGATYRLEVEQVTNHPDFNFSSVTIEACGTNVTGGISTGFVNLFPQNDHEHFIDIDCQENIGSYDPNDKQGFPKGYGAEHFINKNTDLEYLIRFQNTGTDTAFTVVIKDELSPYLDISSIRPGASSHAYDFKMTEERVLEFSFEHIMLPDSNVNEAASHGFVSYKVKQMPNNPNGTQILNKAGIYFDFNPPVITNTTKHTIGENFVELAPSTGIETGIQTTNIKVYPNPFSEQVTFQMEGVEVSTFTFLLYDFQGRLVRQNDFSNLKYEFHRQDLVGGLYFFKIENKGKLIGNGKLVLNH